MKNISPFIFLIVFFIVGCANTETDIQEGDEGISCLLYTSDAADD